MTRPAARGPAALGALLADHLSDLRELDVEGFRVWLQRHLTGWRTDPVFLQRARIRDLRVANPELPALEERQRQARLAYRASPTFHDVEAALRELEGTRKAVAGLSYALRQADGAEERERLGTKLADYEELLIEVQGRVGRLAGSSGERLELERVRRELERARERLGFDAEVARLEELQRKQGRSSGRSGRAFEASASQAIGRALLPELASGSADPLSVLHGVKLGAAQTEIDQLVVRPHREPKRPVEVVALVEAKRNLNDLAHGLARRLENLAWFAGHRSGYAAERYRTTSSPAGHFEAEAIHLEDGVAHRFTTASFASFLPDLREGRLVRGVYLITRPGTLWGIGSAGLGRIAHRVSSDLAWDPDDPAYLAELLRWCQDLTAPMETPDLLRRYAADPEVAHQVMLIEE